MCPNETYMSSSRGRLLLPTDGSPVAQTVIIMVVIINLWLRVWNCRGLVRFEHKKQLGWV